MEQKIRFISSHKEVVRNKKVLVRSSLNVPTSSGVVLDNFRILKSLPTIQFLLENNAKILIIAHKGRSPYETLYPVFRELKKYIPELVFSDNLQDAKRKLDKKNIVLFENIRKDKREIENSIEFAKELSNGFDIFVQDAFSVCHRNHASVVSLPKYLPSFGGLLLKEEIEHLEKVREERGKSLFVLGGAKFETKEALVEFGLKEFKGLAIVGALANDFFKAMGKNVGDSLVSEKLPKVVKKENLYLPEEVVVNSDSGYRKKSVKNLSLKKGEAIVDVFLPEKLKEKIKKGEFKNIIWNGPFGFYEHNFYAGSFDFLERLEEANSFKIAGGGDTLAVIKKAEKEDVFDFLSTGGGAMLEFLLKGILPGIEAISQG